MLYSKYHKDYYGKQEDTPLDVTAVCKQLIEDSPKQVQEYVDGKDAIMGFFAGQVMKTLKGKADAAEVNNMIRELLPEPKSIPEKAPKVKRKSYYKPKKKEKVEKAD